MLKWRGVNIDKLSDEQLVIANMHLEQMQEDHIEKTKDPKYIKKFKNQPAPKINPALIELKSAITTEMEKRKISHG